MKVLVIAHAHPDFSVGGAEIAAYNLFGALKTAMATCGYETVKEFQKAEVMVAPSLQTEGKFFQRSQGVGMGH